MPDFVIVLLAVLAAYLLGSVPFAVVCSRLFGLADPRSYGSKNPGATNVLRSGNKAAAALTLLGDMAKGWLAVFLAQTFGPKYGFSHGLVGAVALAVFFGHLYPVFLNFKGGKGVATAAGVLLALDPLLGLITLGIWLGIAFVMRYSSLAALVAAAAAPVVAFLFWGSGTLRRTTPLIPQQRAPTAHGGAPEVLPKCPGLVFARTEENVRTRPGKCQNPFLPEGTGHQARDGLAQQHILAHLHHLFELIVQKFNRPHEHNIHPVDGGRPVGQKHLLQTALHCT